MELSGLSDQSNLIFNEPVKRQERFIIAAFKFVDGRVKKIVIISGLLTCDILRLS